MNMIVVGTGYVGLVTGTCIAEMGHKVICVDIDEEKIAKLKKGIIPIYEPGLENLIQKNVQQRRLFFDNKIGHYIKYAEAVFIAVGTPPKKNGEADLSYVEKAVMNIACKLNEYDNKYLVFINKSTVPVGTGEKVRKIIKTIYDGSFDVVSNPEFLREGSAIDDFMNPDRIVVGGESREAQEVMKKIYVNLNCKKVFTSIKSAEMIKYASNAFLATKISFINEIANLCERVGADVEEVANGIGLDRRIGKSFLNAGVGYGGSCFPKDVRALEQIAGHGGYDFKLLKAVIEVNNNQREFLKQKIIAELGDLRGKFVGVLGLAFKGNTDDVRESPAIDIVEFLIGKGAIVSVYDPIATENAKKVLSKSVNFFNNSYEAAQKSEALVIATEWEEFKNLDFIRVGELMKDNIIIDGKNLYNPKIMEDMGFRYVSVGR